PPIFAGVDRARGADDGDEREKKRADSVEAQMHGLAAKMKITPPLPRRAAGEHGDGGSQRCSRGDERQDEPNAWRPARDNADEQARGGARKQQSWTHVRDGRPCVTELPASFALVALMRNLKAKKK